MKWSLPLLLATLGCSHDFIDLGDTPGCDCACPDAQSSEAETLDPVDDAADAPDESTAADVATEAAPPPDGDGAEADVVEPDAPGPDAPDVADPDAGPDVPDVSGDDDGPEDIDAEAEDAYTCEPSACAETCAGYGYPVGTCDGIFCLCGDGAEDGGVEDVGPPTETCHNHLDDDGDTLVDCRDPDCRTRIYCLCEPACPPELVCVAGVCRESP